MSFRIDFRDVVQEAIVRGLLEHDGGPIYLTSKFYETMPGVMSFVDQSIEIAALVEATIVDTGLTEPDKVGVFVEEFLARLCRQEYLLGKLLDAAGYYEGHRPFHSMRCAIGLVGFAIHRRQFPIIPAGAPV